MKFIITNACNLKCSYCFASNITCEQHQFATEQCVDDMIQLANRSHETIRIVGGEPTVHPDFLKIFEKISTYNCLEHKEPTMIFTNGILLNKFYNQMREINPFTGLLSVNDLSTKPAEMQQGLDKTLTTLSENEFAGFYLGCNIHLWQNDYSYIFDIIKKYNYTKSLRISVTTPTNEYSYFLSDPVKYFETIRPILFNFVDRCKKEGIKIHLDCNIIPPCLLSYEEIKSLSEVLATSPSAMFIYDCNLMDIDIDMNYNATRCFSTRDNKYNIESIKDSVTTDDIHKYFDSIYCNNTCKLGKERTNICTCCSGGCNFFTKKED